MARWKMSSPLGFAAAEAASGAGPVDPVSGLCWVAGVVGDRSESRGESGASLGMEVLYPNLSNSDKGDIGIAKVGTQRSLQAMSEWAYDRRVGLRSPKG